jgi:hypothetical protein
LVLVTNPIDWAPCHPGDGTEWHGAVLASQGLPAGLPDRTWLHDRPEARVRQAQLQDPWSKDIERNAGARAQLPPDRKNLRLRVLITPSLNTTLSYNYWRNMAGPGFRPVRPAAAVAPARSRRPVSCSQAVGCERPEADLAASSRDRVRKCRTRPSPELFSGTSLGQESPGSEHNFGEHSTCVRGEDLLE